MTILVIEGIQICGGGPGRGHPLRGHDPFADLRLYVGGRCVERIVVPLPGRAVGDAVVAMAANRVRRHPGRYFQGPGESLGLRNQGVG